ncbi:MAG: PHP domain-containing protein [Lachnospiraceae bacterium]|jgi:predicted metal-dependent phosphoesterase TrpH
MSFIDLHIHTNASDGSCAPEEIVFEALEIGLSAIAITDHDSVDGVYPAIKAARGYPIMVIPGVEITTVFNGRNIHLLGLNIDYTDYTLVSALTETAKIRHDRNEKMCQLLNEHGVDISLDALYRNLGSRVITRSNIAQYLLDNGYVKDKMEAFDKYIGNKSCCYVPKYKLPLETACALILGAKGVCSIAHPVQYKMTEDEYLELFLEAKKMGIQCVEAIHSDNSPEDDIMFRELAKRAGMLITGGSDYHGIFKPDISLGTGRGNLMIPASLLKNIGINI